jgi:hypothetical protein
VQILFYKAHPKAVGMAQAVEILVSKYKALSSNPSTAKNKRKENRKI